MRFFNTTGSVVAEDHDCISPLERLDHAGIRRLIREKRCFIFPAPRQPGKTSALLTLRDLLNREAGLGRLRTDLLIVWPQRERTRKFVIECKILHKGLDQTIAAGLAQTAEYMDRCDAEAGHLVVFERREGRRWEDKVFRDRRMSHNGIEIDIWGM